MSLSTVPAIRGYIEPNVPVDIREWRQADLNGRNAEARFVLKQPEPSGGLRSVFNCAASAMSNMTIGAAVTMAAKSLLVAAGTTAGLPAAAVLIGASVAVGLGRGTIKVAKARALDRLEGRAVTGWTDTKTLCTLALHATFAGIGGSVGYAFHDQIAEAFQKGAGYVATQFDRLAMPQVDRALGFLINKALDMKFPPVHETLAATVAQIVVPIFNLVPPVTESLATAVAPVAKQVNLGLGVITSRMSVDQLSHGPLKPAVISIPALTAGPTPGAEAIIPAVRPVAPIANMPSFVSAQYPTPDSPAPISPALKVGNVIMQGRLDHPASPLAIRDFPPVSMPSQPSLQNVLASLNIETLPGKTRKIINAALSGKAQSLKDVGYFLWNGKGGMIQDRLNATRLIETAAANGSVQAQTDLSFIHGVNEAPAKPSVPHSVVRPVVHHAVVAPAVHDHVSRAVPASVKAEPSLQHRSVSVAKALNSSFTAAGIEAPAGCDPRIDHGKVSFVCIDRTGMIGPNDRVVITVPALK